jgi:hypothetical protein
MGDFGRVGAASLWKSAPFFSTGADKMKPMRSGLRLNLCSPARNSMSAERAEEQEEMGGDFDPRLSTVFARGGGPLPPAVQGPESSS